MYREDQILSLLRLLPIQLQTFHEDTNNLQSTLHVANHYLGNTHRLAALGWVTSDPVRHCLLATCSAQQVTDLSLSVLPATQLYCHPVVQLSLVAGVEESWEELKQESLVLRLSDQSKCLNKYIFYFLFSSFPKISRVPSLPFSN